MPEQDDFDRFYVEVREYDFGEVVLVEPHTGVKIESGNRAEAWERMIEALEGWTGDRPDPDGPLRSLEAVAIKRPRRG